MTGLNIGFSIVFGVCFVIAVTFELIGVKSKRKGDTITENWRFMNAWLSKRVPMAGWVWRVVTLGFLTWCILHFGVGAF